ncbi:MAG: TIR domain-containing protein [Chloroflexota bacterium]|nr:TIR domain-containing protein [Chloroflexota bacterium]
MAIRRKCFISYHVDDAAAVKTFLEDFGDVFIAKEIGVSDEDDFIGSDDREYVMRRVRELYLTDSTVTIVLVGKCTAKRKYIDWEIASTLRNDPKNKRSGLLGINLKSMGNRGLAPPRLEVNRGKDDSFGFYYSYPGSNADLRTMIENAYGRRSTHTPDNSAELFKYNRKC